ncbi:hypothetical protein GG344DRAFT_58192, partial [Lentinula edodes]
DDEIVMVWDLNTNARGKAWGSDEVNVEGWKPIKRLSGDENGVYIGVVGISDSVEIVLSRCHVRCIGSRR